MTSKVTFIILILANLGPALLNFLLPNHAIPNIFAGFIGLGVIGFLIYKMILEHYEKKSND
jgi:hypothetical protein